MDDILSQGEIDALMAGLDSEMASSDAIAGDRASLQATTVDPFLDGDVRLCFEL